MKTKSRIIISVFILLISSTVFVKAQNNYEDVVYLKNGSIVRGTIIEQVPNSTIKIQTIDRNIFVFKSDEIEKITKELLPDKNVEKSVSVKNEIRMVNGKEFLQGNKILLKDEVEVLIRDSRNVVAYQNWSSGQDNLKTSKTLFWIGAPLMLVGSAATIGFAIDGALPPFIIMVTATPIGAGLLIGSIYVNMNGRNKIVQSVNYYNSSLSSSYKKSKIYLTLEPNRSMPGLTLKLTF